MDVSNNFWPWLSQIIFSVFGECLVSWWWWVYCPPRYKRILGSVWRATDCLLQQMNLHQPVSRRNSQHDHVQNMMWIMTVADLVRIWVEFYCWTVAGGVVSSVPEFLLENTIIFSHVSVFLDKISTSAAADLVVLALGLNCCCCDDCRRVSDRWNYFSP